MAARSERDGGRRGTVVKNRNRIVVRRHVWCDAGNGYGYELGLRAGQSVSMTTHGAHQQTHTPPALTSSASRAGKPARSDERRAWVPISLRKRRRTSLQDEFSVLGAPAMYTARQRDSGGPAAAASSHGQPCISQLSSVRLSATCMQRLSGLQSPRQLVRHWEEVLASAKQRR
ncbi:hypothetical protein P171DRAFT_221010 [Karstenula rhodostoma CBS 690.94]|uniref:Uncharacterized protein n=1 Tax=Karstenula rhodostoma CBS 690.94 TaxID=1392251 RepID=A0A9P4PRI5_9PLEO|nr:hypothetical protein P171DRAFT_221010 [Karstenula rhodostoma CBS 690.94]